MIRVPHFMFGVVVRPTIWKLKYSKNSWGMEGMHGLAIGPLLFQWAVV